MKKNIKHNGLELIQDKHDKKSIHLGWGGMTSLTSTATTVPKTKLTGGSLGSEDSPYGHIITDDENAFRILTENINQRKGIKPSIFKRIRLFIKKVFTKKVPVEQTGIYLAEKELEELGDRRIFDVDFSKQVDAHGVMREIKDIPAPEAEQYVWVVLDVEKLKQLRIERGDSYAPVRGRYEDTKEHATVSMCAGVSDVIEYAITELEAVSLGIKLTPI